MLEIIERFLKHTGIKRDTFGRLTVNDPWLIEKMRNGYQLSDEAETIILTFITNYEDAKS